jgi:5-methylcytosine-specific restriction enzyme subunit McrC
MKIPIRNLYYLFCYAWARFPKSDMIDVGIDDCPDIANLFAKILINELHRLTRRGLAQGYVTEQLEVRSPRGRIVIDASIKAQTQIRGTLVCEIDELKRDILENQILKATARELSRTHNIIPSLAHELRKYCKQLADISDTPLILDTFRGLSFRRDKSHYKVIMRICYFVCTNLLPSTTGDGNRFQDVLNDENKMSRVFEEFLRNFYYYEQNEFQVAAEEMEWNARELSESGYNMMPIMKTDITMRSRSSVIIIDAKYYSDPFPEYFGMKKFRSEHLYQLYSYMRHAALSGGARRVKGAIVYAAADGPLLRRYEVDGFPIAVVAIDLSRDWPGIHDELLKLPKLLDHAVPLVVKNGAPPYSSGHGREWVQ